MSARCQRLEDKNNKAVGEAAVSDYDQTKGELCDKCGWAMKFPDEPRRCELERENAALKAVSDEPTSGLCAYIEYLRRRNMEVKIERNRYKVALQDIADAAGFDNIGNWARNKARATLEKEAQP